MAQENGSRFKLVYTHWYEYNGERCPISNGLHPAFVQQLKKIKNENFCKRDMRDFALDRTFQQKRFGYFFRHSNFIYHFRRIHSTSNIIDENQILDDNSIYYFPIEVEWAGMDILIRNREFIVDGVSYTYRFADTVSSNMLELIKQGKVKLLITNLVDASVIKGQVEDFEKIVNDMGIDGSNVVFAQGNKLNYVYELNSHCKIKMVSGMLSLYQAAELFDRYPFYYGQLNYICDIVKEQDLDKNKLRPKKFICFNRSMNRSHRLAMAYIALKYNLLENGIFSFITNLGNNNEIVKEFIKIYPDEDIEKAIKAIGKLVPYELDTHILSPEDKQRFQTIGITKKSWYEDSYIHFISESSFDESLDPFFSEKTWRPIINLQPFLFVGNCNSLAKLKKLGFKTFHPFIDESYDLEQNSRKRFLMIEKEILKLNALSIEEIHNWYYSIVDILLYNQNHLKTFTNYDPYEELYK